jgi:hypothetical protein
MKKILVLFVSATLLISCSKDSDGDKMFKPTFTKLQLTSKAPASLQQNSPETWAEIAQMEAFLSMGGAYMNQNTHRTSNSSANTSSYTWTYGGYTINYSYSTTATQYLFNYTIALNGVNYYTINGWENIDGSAGNWSYNINVSEAGNPSSENFNIAFNWTRNSVGDYNFDMVFDMGSSYVIHYVCNINHDFSGNFSYYLNNAIYYGASWNSNGHGQYTDYSTTPPTVTTF